MVVKDGRQTLPGETTVLVIEDELRSQRLLRMNLEPLGYRVVTINTASDGADLIDTYDPDVIVLGLKLPGANGFDLLCQLRALSPMPIIIISGVSHPTQKVRGLKLGADDFITKPYDPAELAARITAILRRAQGLPPVPTPGFRNGELEIDFTQRLVRVGGREVALAGTEYRLLEALAENAGRTLVADALITRVWGASYVGEYPSLHLYISRLRRKLGDNAQQSRWIMTKPGVGYQMVAADERPSETSRERERGMSS